MKQFKVTNRITERSSDSFVAYLKEVNKHPLLSIEEEVEVARRMRQGDRKAFETLINSNLRFVISVAKQYQNQGLTLSDLVNEGNLGLIKAAEKFDETKGFKFISYAVWWVRQSILQALANQSRTIRLPVNQVANLTKINKFIREFEQDENRKPSVKEISEFIKISEEKVSDLLEISCKCASIDSPIGDEEDDVYLVNLIPNDTPDPDDTLDKESVNYSIHKALKVLSLREHDVILMLFGLDGVKCQTMTEIAKKFGITSERIRQIRDQALDKLKRNKELKLLL